MSTISPTLVWIIVAVMLALAAAATLLCMRKPLLFVLALLLSPAPAFLLVRMTAPVYPDASTSEQLSGVLFSALSCYMAVWLGVLAAYLSRARRQGDPEVQAQDHRVSNEGFRQDVIENATTGDGFGESSGGRPRSRRPRLD